MGLDTSCLHGPYMRYSAHLPQQTALHTKHGTWHNYNWQKHPSATASRPKKSHETS